MYITIITPVRSCQKSDCIRLFLKAERDRNHLLHSPIPKKLQNSDRLQIPHCRTEKKKEHLLSLCSSTY